MRFRVGALLVGILAVAASPTFAQVTGSVKVGVNFAKTVFEEDDLDEGESDNRTGLVVGAGIDVPIAPMFSFQPEFLYTQKGGKNGDLIFPGDPDVTLKVDMVQIPLLLKVGGTEGPVRPFVVAGPAVGFVTTAKIAQDGIDDDLDIKDDVEKVDFSGIIGGGVQFGRGIIEVRYDHGFRDLDKEDLSSAKPRTFSILFGYAFGG